MLIFSVFSWLSHNPKGDYPNVYTGVPQVE